MVHASETTISELVILATALLAPACRGRVDPGPAMAVAATAIEVAQSVSESRRSSEIAAYSPPSAVPPPVLLWPRDAVPPRGFDLPAVRRAFHDVDLNACTSGYGAQVHAKVTLASTGDVSAIAIDDPPNMPPETIQCIGDHVGAAHVPPFAPFAPNGANGANGASEANEANENGSGDLTVEITFALPARDP